MVDSYVILNRKPLASGPVVSTPNVHKSEFLDGFTAISQNGPNAVTREFSIIQPVEDDAEMVLLNDFLIAHVATPFEIEFWDLDRTGTTKIIVKLDGPWIMPRSRHPVTFPVRESS